MPLNYMGRVVKQKCQVSVDFVLCLLPGRYHAGPSVNINSVKVSGTSDSSVGQPLRKGRR